MFRCFLLVLLSISFVSAQVVSETDLLMTRQDFGAPKINKSVNNNPLRIAQITYTHTNRTQGIGTHATSMIPLSIPSNATILSGACGIDDEVSGTGGVQFKILSGSEVLWTSEIMKKGMKAQPFNVSIPQGAKKLYLFTDSIGSKDDNHADWVNLSWQQNKKESEHLTLPSFSQKEKAYVIETETLGFTPNNKQDQGPALRAIISYARQISKATDEKVIINIPKGEYHFYPEGALPMSFHISNHDQPDIQPVCVPLVDLNNITLSSHDGALFLYHGYELPLLIMDSENVTVKNISLDYVHPQFAEFIIKSINGSTTIGSIDKQQYPYKIEHKKFKFIGEGWERSVQCAMAFHKNGHIAADTADIGMNPDVTENSDGSLTLNFNAEHYGLQPEDRLLLRSYNRPYPAVCLYRANNTQLQNLAIHQSMGMGLLAQRSINVHVQGGGVFVRKGVDRLFTTTADATHYSNVGGKIISENSTFTGMMDDAINVHSTCLNIDKIIDSKTIECRYVHPQAVGFEVFLPGEKLRFIAGPTLENKEIATVEQVHKLDTTHVQITLKTPLPQGIQCGDAIENADYQPAVIFNNNHISNNRARGSLFTTPKPVTVTNNFFDHSSGSAILLAGDAQGWYESGACESVLIKNNTFTNNLTSRYQFTEAIISIYPEIKQLTQQTAYYHRNVIITHNKFETFNVPLLYTISTQNLQFTYNTIHYNNDYKSWNLPPFIFRRCSNILIKNNTITPPQKWSLEKDIRLENTPKETVKGL